MTDMKTVGEEGELHMEKDIKNCPVCNIKGKFVHKGVRDNRDIDVYMCTECGTKY